MEVDHVNRNCYNYGNLNTWQNTIKIEETYYNLTTLGLIKESNLILELTQENLMEFLVQGIYIYTN